jgi:hypothetical protein
VLPLGDGVSQVMIRLNNLIAGLPGGRCIFDSGSGIFRVAGCAIMRFPGKQCVFCLPQQIRNVSFAWFLFDGVEIHCYESFDGLVLCCFAERVASCINCSIVVVIPSSGAGT